MPRRLDAETDAAAPSVIDADLRVPCGEAIRAGEFVAVLAALIAGGIIVRWADVEWWVVLARAGYIGAVTGSVVGLAVYAVLVVDERRDRKRARNVPTPEPPIAVGVPGEPSRQLVTLRLDEGGSSRYVHDIPMSPGMRRFARRLAKENGSFSERGAAECGVGRDDFLALRDQLLERGIVAWKNPDSPRAGYSFGRGFEKAMEALAEGMEE